jgi:hypothetical protein
VVRRARSSAVRGAKIIRAEGVVRTTPGASENAREGQRAQTPTPAPAQATQASPARRRRGEQEGGALGLAQTGRPGGRWRGGGRGSSPRRVAGRRGGGAQDHHPPRAAQASHDASGGTRRCGDRTSADTTATASLPDAGAIGPRSTTREWADARRGVLGRRRGVGEVASNSTPRFGPTKVRAVTAADRRSHGRPTDR